MDSDFFMRKGEYIKQENELEKEFLEWKLDFKHVPPHVYYGRQLVYDQMVIKMLDDTKHNFWKNKTWVYMISTYISV